MEEPTTAGGLGLLEQTQLNEQVEGGWQTILYNDPVNTFDYVIALCQRILKCDKETAKLYTSRVHYEGKAIVYTGGQEQAESYAAAFSAAHLWCSAEKAS